MLSKASHHAQEDNISDLHLSNLKRQKCSQVLPTTHSANLQTQPKWSHSRAHPSQQKTRQLHLRCLSIRCRTVHVLTRKGLPRRKNCFVVKATSASPASKEDFASAFCSDQPMSCKIKLHTQNDWLCVGPLPSLYRILSSFLFGQHVERGGNLKIAPAEQRRAAPGIAKRRATPGAPSDAGRRRQAPVADDAGAPGSAGRAEQRRATPGDAKRRARRATPGAPGDAKRRATPGDAKRRATPGDAKRRATPGDASAEQNSSPAWTDGG